MTKLKHRLRNSALVLTRDAWRFWATLLLLPIVLFAPALWTCSAVNALMYAGAGLELAGLGTVAWGLHKTRQRFGRASLWDSFGSWLAKLKNAILLPPITGEGRIVLGELRVTGSASTSMRPTVGPETLEGRIAALEGAQRELRESVARLAENSTLLANEVRAALRDEIASRERAQAEIRSLLEEEAAGGLHLEVMGLVWLAAGILTSSLPGDLARALPSYPCLW